ncbi:hypothetical protein VE03_09023 [Pseudogymnoascus sp. 23342-1-I1]|nr:hypothetical protein VE03_09023 [Pseudogymnoascus sp. 23342-1-I1]
MHYSSLLALAGASLAAAAPAITNARAEGTWTLKGFVRTCDDAANSCNYVFNVLDNVSGSLDACNFTDVADSTRQARWSSPSNLHCAANSTIYVNVGYDQPGSFFVVVPVNRETSVNAFFGYSAAELADGVVVTPDKTSNSLVVGTWEKKKAAGAAVIGRAAAADLGAWTVEGLHRTCQTSNIATCNYSFQINQNNGSAKTNCYLSQEGAPTQSFYTAVCQKQVDWVISWGYNDQYGYAVMTVVNVPKQQDAFFGFNDINLVTDFPNIGPNPVYAL